MSNNKQQTAVDILCGKLAMKLGIPQAITFYIDHQEEIKQAKEMEVMGKEMSYSEGYKEGYQRALDYMTDTIKNTIQIKENGSNNSTTVNTTGTTFVCTEFVSDQLFYKGTLPRCMKCGKPSYQHPIISNTI